jgi:hypothetical protein
MAYVLDTSMLIDAKDYYYGFALCPGFWEWVEREAAAGEVISVAEVRKEIERQEDELTEWVRKMPRDFFRTADLPAAEALRRVIEWVQGQDFTDAAKREFADDPDARVIAYALAHGHTVVTHEVDNPDQKSKVKIPRVCRAMHVDCKPAFPWLKERGARFILDDGRPRAAEIIEQEPVQAALFSANEG